MGSLVHANNILGSTGRVQWLEPIFASDGVVSYISSEGGMEDSLSITSDTPVNGVGLGFNLEVTSSYVNYSTDAIVFKLTTSDGKIWQKNYSLTQAGRSVIRIYTSCPSPYPQMIRPDPDDLRCKGILGDFYGITSNITQWQIVLNTPPSGEHKIGVNLLSEIQ
jgi:hypothetical protein